MARDIHFVVGQEDDAPLEFRVGGQVHNLLDKRLAILIGRMSFAGVDDLNGAIRVANQPLEALQVIHDEVGALIGGESSSEADGQDRKSTRLNSSHVRISYAVFCLKKKNKF